MVGGCCVCSDDRGWTENPLVYCDGQGCTVAVHQACYGIVTVPTGNWYCRKCESQERTARVQRCELCPSKDGALKRTDTNGWAHVVCALYIPEVRFGNVTTMEPILLQQIPPERFNKACYICEESGKGARSTIGACMQCNKSGCKQQFHVTCAQALGLLCEEAGNYLDNVKYCGYCQHHYSKLKKSGNVKTIPPYRPISNDNASDSSSPEKEPGDNWSKTTAKRKLSAGGKPTGLGSAGLKAPVNISPGPSGVDISSSQVDDIGSIQSGVGPGGIVQMKDSVPVLTQVNTGKSDSSSGGKFTTSNFVEGVVTPSESVFGEVSKSSSKKRKKDDVTVPVGSVVNPDDSSKKFKSDNVSQQDGVQPASVVVKLPVGANVGAAGSNSPIPAASLPSRIISTCSLSPSTTSSIVVSVPLATVSALPTTVTPPTITTVTTTPSLTAMTVTTSVASSNSVLTNNTSNDESPTKRGRSQSTEKGDKSGRNKKRGGGSVSTNVGSKRGGRSNQSTPPPPPPPLPAPAVSVTVSVSSVTTSVVTAPTPATTASVVTPSATPASVVAHSSAVVKVESPPSSPDGSKRSNHKSRKHQNAKDEKDVKQDVKVFQNGINAPHMLGNQLNPSSTMAQKMSDTLNQELEAHSIFTNDSNLPNILVGPQLHSRVIASVRSSNASTTTTASSSGTNSVTTTTSSGVGWGGGQGTVPQTLDQLLERQWEQGSQFLMEQAQHFDIASLLSCLHQLRAENLRLEEHVNSLLQRRDHLLAVNARLAIPLTQGSVAVNNVHPATAGVLPGIPQPGQVVTDGSRGTTQRVNNSYPTAHPLENGLPPSPPTTAYRASPAQPSPSTISRHHSPGNAAAYVSSTPGVVVPRGSVTNEPHRSDSRRSNPQPSGPPPPQPTSYPAMYQVPSQQQQQLVMRREVVADLHNQIPPASKPS